MCFLFPVVANLVYDHYIPLGRNDYVSSGDGFPSLHLFSFWVNRILKINLENKAIFLVKRTSITG